MPFTRSHSLVATAAVGALALTAFAPPPVARTRVAVPQEVPDRGPVASEPMTRGRLAVTDTTSRVPAAHVIDGDPSDWAGEPSRIGGTTRFDGGEHIYSDFIHDAWGADDGDDARRLSVLGPLANAERRLTRADALFQALGAQFGAPDPAGADEAYGDQLANDVADIATVRWATSDAGETLDLLVEVSNLTDADDLAVLVMADMFPVTPGQRTATGIGGLTTTRFETALLITDDQVQATYIQGGGIPPMSMSLGDLAAVDADGWVNTLEARLPAELLVPDGSAPGSEEMAGRFSGTVVTGRWDGKTFTPANVAYRGNEPVAGMYNDQRQALALQAGNVDAFRTGFAVADLVAGRTQSVHPGAGYHERTFRSDEGISAELREGLDDVYEDTVWQRYALFVPSDHDPSEAEQATFWLHYRGGKAHSGGAWSPRLFTQLGEEVGGIVVTPHGRGERRWYEGSSHQDFWEVYEDLHATFTIDPARRYLSGYSMGGHGGPMMGLLYPDRFAGVYIQAGAIGSNLLDVAVNATHVPFWLDVSSQDALVAINQQMASQLDALGNRHVIQRFLAGEHYTQAILDEWASGARYLQQHETPTNPRRVTYRVVPSLIETINEGRGEPTSRRFSPDGAWWVDDIVVAPDAEHGTVTAEARTLPGDDVTTVVDLGEVQPLDHSVPSVRTGLGWIRTPATVDAAVDVDLVGVASVTLDAERWEMTGPTQLTITSDGPAQVLIRLDDSRWTVPVEAGTRTFTLG